MARTNVGIGANGMGNYLEINHGNGVSRYSHLKDQGFQWERVLRAR